MDQLREKLSTLRQKVVSTMELVHVEQARAELRGLEERMNVPSFWQDQRLAADVSQKAAGLREDIGRWEKLLKDIDDLCSLIDVAAHEQEQGTTLDSSLQGEIEQRYTQLEQSFAQLEFVILFDGTYDANNAIISIHAGTGGTDAQDWANMLERMYLRFFERKRWQAEVLERTVGAEAGIKSVMIKISGRWAYGYLRSEAGVHRLVRISPFDAEAMRHTSFALVDVIPELPETAEIELRDDEIRIDVFRSGGAGGQSVNTTDSAVRIVHIPTGITVTCQNERSQSQNRETALHILKSKLAQREEQRRAEEEARLRGGIVSAEWGNQIRSYVLQPYRMVKDHRTGYETQETDRVLDGDIEAFVEGYLRWKKSSIQ